MRWSLQSDRIPQSLDDLESILLANRGINNAESYFHPPHPDSLALSDLGIDAEAVRYTIDRLMKARDSEELVVIYGDYDCDGVCATAILWETLTAVGVRAIPFIPQRDMHGYGLSAKGLDAVFQSFQPHILITVDNGIVAHTQWGRLRSLGITTILTDHHEPDATVPTVDACIHTTKLCGTTVAWITAREIVKQLGSANARKHHSASLDLCAIATIADQVPLIGPNRAFAYWGISRLNSTTRIGLRQLIEAAGLTQGSIDTTGVNYGIAPRINAMGRLSSAMDALRALCTKSEDRARGLIQTLHETNRTRQELTTEFSMIALEQAATQQEERLIIVAHEDFHEGVIGLIASKLVEVTGKPTIALALGLTTAKGSARSVKGVHITKLLRMLREELIEVGGHPLAAGLKIDRDNLSSFKCRLQTLAKESIHPDQLIPDITVDCQIDHTLLDAKILKKIQQFAPFGAANAEPIFLLSAVRILSVQSIGKEGKHLKLLIEFPESEHKHPLTILAWGKGSQTGNFTIGTSVDIVLRVQENTWKNVTTLQGILVDSRTVK